LSSAFCWRCSWTVSGKSGWNVASSPSPLETWLSKSRGTRRLSDGSTPYQIPPKLHSLERDIRVLRGDDPVADTAAFVQDLAESARSIRPWLVDDRYQALRSSGQLRLIRDRTVASEMAGFNRAPAVLFGMADEIRGDYRRVVHEILPPELAPELSQLEGYAPDSMRDPVWFEGSADYARTLRDLRRRGDELLALAQNEAAYFAAYQRALKGYRYAMSAILEILEPWRPEVRRTPAALQQDRSR